MDLSIHEAKNHGNKGSLKALNCSPQIKEGDKTSVTGLHDSTLGDIEQEVNSKDRNEADGCLHSSFKVLWT